MSIYVIWFRFPFSPQRRRERKEKILFFCRWEDGKRKKSIATRCFSALNARRACCLLFSVLSTENNKINKLCVLCDSNERSEWAVSSFIITEAISNRSHSKTTIFCIMIMSLWETIPWSLESCPHLFFWRWSYVSFYQENNPLYAFRKIYLSLEI